MILASMENAEIDIAEPKKEANASPWNDWKLRPYKSRRLRRGCFGIPAVGDGKSWQRTGSPDWRRSGAH